MQSVDNVRKELAGKEIYIIRHAQGEHNVSSKFSFDPPLTTEGTLHTPARFCPTLSLWVYARAFSFDSCQVSSR